MLQRGLPKSVVPRAPSFPSQWFEMFLGRCPRLSGFPCWSSRHAFLFLRPSRLSERAPMWALHPKLARDRGQSATRGRALPEKPEYSQGSCSRQYPSLLSPLNITLHLDSAEWGVSDLDCPAGAGVLVCRERTVTPGRSECLILKTTEQGSHEGEPFATG